MGHLFLMERGFEDSPNRERAAEGPCRVEPRGGGGAVASSHGPPGCGGTPGFARAQEGITWGGVIS